MEKCKISGVDKCAKLFLEQIDTTFEDLNKLGAVEVINDENNRRVQIAKRLQKGVCENCAHHKSIDPSK